jgi:hypothetical protein
VVKNKNLISHSVSKVKVRLTFKCLITDFIDTTFSLEKGIFFTFWMMIKNPKKVAETFINRDSKSFTTPIKFVIVSVTLLVLLHNGVEVKDFSMLQVTEDETGEFEQMFFYNFEKFYNFIMIGVIPFVSFAHGGCLEKRNKIMLKI